MNGNQGTGIQPLRQSQVDEQLIHIEDGTAELINLVDEVSIRFGAVLNLTLPSSSPVGLAEKPDLPLVPLADRLRGINKRQQKTIESLRHILASAEL